MPTEKNKDCSDIKYEPQSVEQLSGFPEGNFPKDGKLASGGIARFSSLDQTGENRWDKNQIQVGDNNSLAFNSSTQYCSLALLYY
ncbi:MAG TPA: lytic polysaccharide monooxygenase [Arsenophonus sp.]